MSATDTIRVGEPLPLIASVSPHDRWTVAVTWADGRGQLVDLAPVVFTKKLYRPLRGDPALFRTVHVLDGGSAIGWGDDDSVDMDASTVARLAKSGAA